jgi:hypothetical protein
MLERVSDRFVDTLNPADAQRGRAGLWLAVTLAGLGEDDRASRLLRDALPVLETALGKDAVESRLARRALARIRG